MTDDNGASRVVKKEALIVRMCHDDSNGYKSARKTNKPPEELWRDTELL
jgi:hypothetical protein